jgi:cell volume regulation protein A
VAEDAAEMPRFGSSDPSPTVEGAPAPCLPADPHLAFRASTTVEQLHGFLGLPMDPPLPKEMADSSLGSLLTAAQLAGAVEMVRVRG